MDESSLTEAGLDDGGTGAGRPAGLEIGQRIADHPGLLEVDVELVPSLEQHTRQRLPARAAVAGRVRTIVDPVERRAGLLEALAKRVVHRFDEIGRKEAATDA